jgi:hypothetical protein
LLLPTADRPQLKKLMRDLAPGDIVITPAVDRLSWKAAVLVKHEPLSGRHRPISIPQLRYPLKAMAMQQCSAGANYGRGNWREIARGADIAAAPPLRPGYVARQRIGHPQSINQCRIITALRWADPAGARVP